MRPTIFQSLVSPHYVFYIKGKNMKAAFSIEAFLGKGRVGIEKHSS